LEYRDEDLLQDIENGLGEFVKIGKEMKLRRYTSYARICVYMHLNIALLDAVSLYHDDFEWIQSIDYEYIPFRCRKCHSLGHLFHDRPSNLNTSNSPTLDKPDSDGFIKVTNRKKDHKKPSSILKESIANASKPSTNNNFEILNQSELNNSKIPDHFVEIPKMIPQSTTLILKKTQKSVHSTDLKSA